jgi:hypothetical protein
MIPETVVIVGEQIAGESAKVRKQVEELLKTIDSSVFDLAELLYKVKKNGFYKPEFETFLEYGTSLGLKESRIFYLPKIVDVMEQVGVDRNTYEPVGTPRLREIVRLDPNSSWTNPETNETFPMKDFIVGLVEKGADMSLKDVKQHVRTLKGQIGENEIINKTFGWTKLTFENTIDPALELAKRNIGSLGKDAEGNTVDPSDSRAAEMWAIEYLNNPANNIVEDTDGTDS